MVQPQRKKVSHESVTKRSVRQTMECARTHVRVDADLRASRTHTNKPKQLRGRLGEGCLCTSVHKHEDTLSVNRRMAKHTDHTGKHERRVSGVSFAVWEM